MPVLWPLLLLLLPLLVLLPLLPLLLLLLLLLLLAPPPRPLVTFDLSLLLMLGECSGAVRMESCCCAVVSLSLDRSRLVRCLVAVPRCVNASWNPETNETKMKPRC